MTKHAIDRRDFLKTLGVYTAATATAWNATSMATRPSKRPNFLIILADDQGWGDLRVHGNMNLNTPNIDSIARDGALFDRFFVCAVCAPTRAEFLTGRYHARGGVRGVSRGAERLNLDEKTIAETFKSAGYVTAAYGKWHNGTQYPYHPNARGFDDFYGFCSGHWGLYFSPMLEHNGKLVRGKGYITDDLTNHAIHFIEQNKDRPFFCYVPFNVPHSPFEVPDNFYDKFASCSIEMRNRDPEKEELGKTRAVLAMCENIDWNVGRLLDTLKKLGLADNTVVIYFSDNGPNSWRWNGGMKGKKGSVDEGGLRVPCMFRWPGHIKPGSRIPQIAGAIDMLPTLADIAQIPIVSTKPLDGISVKPLLLGTATSWPDRMIISHQGDRLSVRTQRYRLDNNGALFDMETDGGQYHDISAQKPEITARLKKARDTFRRDVLPKTPDDRPFTVGFDDDGRGTMLPARDGIPSGHVKRSGRAPNCSFFTNWTSPEDAMTWDIEVGKTGIYKAQAYYTCSKDNLGSTVELSFKGNRTSARVTVPNNPPLVGAKLDRFVRSGESYVKDFKPMSLGKIRLDKGRGTLTLRATDVAGTQVMDVRMIVLTLIK